MNLAAIIFDVDGTLAETERDGHRLAFNAAFSETGLSWRWDETLYGELLDVTGGKERIRHYATCYDPEFLARPDCDKRIARLHALKTRHFMSRLEQGGIPLRPGIAQLVGACRKAGVRLAIATTTAPQNVVALLRANCGPAAETWFEVIGAGDAVTAKKPAPDIYHWVLRRLGLSARECLAIEDSANGLAASTGCGIPTLITTSSYTLDQDFTNALAVLPDLGGVGLAQLLQLHSLAYDYHKNL